MIDTIFYFTNGLDKDSYVQKVNSSQISPRTIVFSIDNKAIYTKGEQFGNMSTEDLTEVINQIFNSKQIDLPKATTTTLGAIIVGDCLGVDTAGRLSVDGNALKNVITKEYIESVYTLPVASSTKLGGIKVGNGLAISNGVLSVNLSDPNINVTSKDYSITQFTNEGSIIELRQNNNVNSPLELDIKNAVKQSITKLVQEGDSVINKIGEKTDVSVDPVISTGTKIATITVDGVVKELFSPSGNGSSSSDTTVVTYDDTDIRNAIEELQNRADATKESLDDLLNETEEEVREKFKEAFATYEDLINYYNQSGDTTYSNYTFGEDDVETWASEKGLITKNDDGTYTVGWSSLQQSYNEISAQVTQIKANQSVGGEVDYEALSSSLYTYINDNAATSGMDSTWGKFVKNDDGEIQFLEQFHSAIDTYATDGLTYSDLMSSAKDYNTNQSAIANVVTKVENVDGDLVSTTSIGGLVETEVSSSLSQIFTDNSSNDAVAGLYARLKTVEGESGIAGLTTKVEKINGTLESQSTLLSELDGKYASVTTTVTKNDKDEIESDVTIKADQINLEGSVTFVNAIGQYVSAGQMVITDDDAVVAGMANGKYISNSNSITDSSNSVRLWAGQPTDSTGKDISYAPFYVTYNGILHANEAQFKNTNLVHSTLSHNIILSTQYTGVSTFNMWNTSDGLLDYYADADGNSANWETTANYTFALKGDIVVLGGAVTSDDTSFTVYLPPASKFSGQIIKIINGTYDSSTRMPRPSIINLETFNYDLYAESEDPENQSNFTDSTTGYIRNTFVSAVPYAYSGGVLIGPIQSTYSSSDGGVIGSSTTRYAQIELVSTKSTYGEDAGANDDYVWLIINATPASTT